MREGHCPSLHSHIGATPSSSPSQIDTLTLSHPLTLALSHTLTHTPPQDIVIGRHRDIEDRISWCLAAGRFEAALSLAEADRNTRQEVWDAVAQVRARCGIAALFLDVMWLWSGETYGGKRAKRM